MFPLPWSKQRLNGKWKIVFNQGLGYYQVNITTERETRDGIIAVQG